MIELRLEGDIYLNGKINNLEWVVGGFLLPHWIDYSAADSDLLPFIACVLYIYCINNLCVMNTSVNKLVIALLVVLIAFVVGFFLGRKTIDVEEKVTFVKGETIRDTIVIPQPTFVEIPAKPK